MEIRKWVNISRGKPTARMRGEAAPAAARGEEEREGVFFTPQSLVTFPGATLAVGVIWKTLAALVPMLAGTLWLPFVLCCLMGGFLYYLDVSDPKKAPTERDLWISRGIGVINTFYLFGATTGISQAAGM